MKLRKTYCSSVSEFTLKIALAFLFLFLASAGFRDSRTSGWYRQYFPNLNGSSITGMTFLDSLTGYAVTNPGTGIYCYILKTTNGGDNWVINYTYNSGSNIRLTKIQFSDNNIGYASTTFFDFFKTTNAGLNWIQMSTPDGAEDMAVINKDTVLVVTSDGFAGGVYRTTNGGYNWHALGQVGGSGQPNIIYMFDKNLGFVIHNPSYSMRRTTDGGLNWTYITGEYFTGIQFVDSLTGWKTYGGVKKTTDGGLTWISQTLPILPHYWVTSYVFALNKDTAWVVGDAWSNGPIYKTTNGGSNWGYQLTDTSIHTTYYDYIYFANNKTGWAKTSSYHSEIHTTSGGSDTTFYTGIKLVEEFTPKEYSLGQNYPNPFNPSTNIPFELKNGGYVTLRVYDITGRMVKELMNGRWGRGSYVCDFDGAGLPSGIYIYRLMLDNAEQGVRKMMLIK